MKSGHFDGVTVKISMESTEVKDSLDLIKPLRTTKWNYQEHEKGSWEVKNCKSLWDTNIVL